MRPLSRTMPRESHEVLLPLGAAKIHLRHRRQQMPGPACFCEHCEGLGRQVADGHRGAQKDGHEDASSDRSLDGWPDGRRRLAVDGVHQPLLWHPHVRRAHALALVVLALPSERLRHRFRARARRRRLDVALHLVAGEVGLHACLKRPRVLGQEFGGACDVRVWTLPRVCEVHPLREETSMQRNVSAVILRNFVQLRYEGSRQGLVAGNMC
mmetsp:Transcript_72622/g.183626  ORF Transcript_72622/g.183626 Transcript_72622/m.183626 type:complete len:211 (-) Transcript_72622:172-804(-)